MTKLYIFIAVTGKTPTLPQLLDLEIPHHVGVKYMVFGIYLLGDVDGNRVHIIKKDCSGKAEEITLAILTEWLSGKGTPVSWESLIETLRKCKIGYLADQIQMALEKL